MIRIYFILILFSLSNVYSQDWSDAFAPQFQYNGFGYSTNDNARSVATDNSGNVFVTGSFEGRLIIGTDTLVSNGSIDIYVAKYNQQGIPLWAISGGGPSADYGMTIAIDASGNALISGYFFDTARLGDIEIVSYRNSDIYIAKVNSAGVWQWAKAFGGNGFDKGQTVSSDANSNIYVGGIFEQTAYFESDSIISAGLRDMFVCKLNSIGEIQWINKAGSTSTDDLYGITTDNSGNSFVTGYFQSTCFFANKTVATSGLRDIFVSKIDQNGNWIWARKAGGIKNDIANDITLDDNGDLFVIGSFENTLILNAIEYTSAGKRDLIVAKLDSAGNWISAIIGGGSENDQGIAIVRKGSDLAIAGSFQGVATFDADSYYSQGSLDILIADLSSNLSWSNIKTAGGTSVDEPNDIASDSQNGTFTCGYSYGNSSFGVFNLFGVGNSDGFLIRQYSSSSWVWAKSIAGILDYAEINDIISDKKSNKYVIGTYYGTIQFGINSITSSGLSDVFVAKIDSSDNYIWVRTLGGNGYDQGASIDIDTSGNIYIAGDFSINANFGSINVNSKALRDAFVAKLDSNGAWIWAKNAGGSLDDKASGVAVDNHGNVYLSGSFYNKAYFSSISINAEGYDDAFIAKLDAAGNWIWAKNAGGSDFDFSKGVAVDTSGNAYLYGSFFTEATFGSITLTSAGNDDGYIAKINSTGNWLWAAQMGGTSDLDGVNDVIILGEDEIFACGSFANLSSFGSIQLPSKGDLDLFIAKLDDNGSWLWVKDYGGNGFDVAQSIDFDTDNYLYATGIFSESIAFGDKQLNSAGMKDIFLIQMDSDGELNWAAQGGGNFDDNASGVTALSPGLSYVTGSYNGVASFDINTLFNRTYLDKNAFIAKNEFRPQPSWEVVANTGRSATIAIPDSVVPKFEGNNVSYGDAIGVFYDRNGLYECAGYGIWEFGGLEFTVWGDDFSTQIKDGFISGEKYKFKIWDAQSDSEYFVGARFSSGPNYFSHNATSVVETMPAVWDTLAISLSVGWNSISSYCEPEEALMDEVFKVDRTKVLIVKNGAGKIYVPQYNINTIGDWNLTNGYNVYSTQNFDFKIAGVLQEPGDYPISLNGGWNFISYLRNSEISVVTALAPIVSKLLIAKNGKGKIYVPQYNINTIGNMVPTESYQMYLTSPAVLTYPDND